MIAILLSTLTHASSIKGEGSIPAFLSVQFRDLSNPGCFSPGGGAGFQFCPSEGHFQRAPVGEINRPCVKTTHKIAQGIPSFHLGGLYDAAVRP